jgi:hypothetical protein
MTSEQKKSVHALERVCWLFSLEYTEMPGLDRSLVEHRLPIKQGFWPYKQLVRNYSPKIIGRVKEEVN